MKKNKKIKIGIIGTVGVPACYGGFETLVENLLPLPCDAIVYCSKKKYNETKKTYKDAQLIYFPFEANGIQSIIYDMVSIIHAGLKGCTGVLILGVSGALILPLVSFLFPNMKLIVNIDGVEWKRDKWNKFAKFYLKLSESVAIKYSQKVITDNRAIANYVKNEYAKDSEVIAYGGDHAIDLNAIPHNISLPEKYALALCRIEPENNVALILEAFSLSSNLNIVFIGNWNSSKFGIELRDRFKNFNNIYLIDPIYDVGILKFIRSKALIYIHGHSAGGTNPSLVEMMHFGIPIFCFDCNFNRFTTDDNAVYFSSILDLSLKLNSIDLKKLDDCGIKMKRIALERYCWTDIRKKYFDLLSLCF